MAAKKSIADEAIQRSVSPGPIYYVAWHIEWLFDGSLLFWFIA